MKKLKSLLLVLAVLVLLPLNVFAKDKINVYIFRGEGCGYCAKALTFFDGLSDEYKSYFNLVQKEVWNDENNAKDMQKVAKHFNEEVGGVPYIIVGEKTFQGFDESYGEEIKTAIKEYYENEDSYKDVVASVLGGQIEEKDSNSAVTIIVIIAAIAGIGFLIYMARDDEEKETEKVVKIKEEKKEEPTVKKAAPKKTSATKKTSTTKKTTTAKKTTSKKPAAKKTTANTKKPTNKK